MSRLLAPAPPGTTPWPDRSAGVGVALNAPKAGETSARLRRLGSPSISCVLPCHNEARNLAVLLPMLAELLDVCAHAWEIVLVDDGSTDETPVLLERWAQQPGFRCLQLSRNFGKEAALMAGLQAAAGDVVVSMDADMQHSPSLIPVFLEQWLAGADVAYAVRASRHDEGPLKRIGTRWFYRLINGNDRFQVPANAGDFRLMDRAVVDTLLSLPERNRFMKGLYAWAGFHAVAVPYLPDARAHGRSNFNALRLVRLSLDGLTAFTTLPLRAVSAMGFAMAVLSLGYGAYLTVRHMLYGADVGGWTTIVVSLMLFAGIQLISLGVVGEYVGRVFEEVKARPLFVVRRETGLGMKRVPR